MENWRPIRKKPNFNKELFFYEKSHYLKNGISLTEVLKLSENPQEEALSEQLLVGWSLSEAMGTLNLFQTREIHLVKLAEETGDLAGAFERIAQSLKEERMFKEKIIGILIYPALLLVATVVFFIGLMSNNEYCIGCYGSATNVISRTNTFIQRLGVFKK